MHEKSASVWNRTWDLLYYKQVHSPLINFALWQVGGLSNIHTTNELLLDTYVNNKLLNGMPSVVAFYYQLAT